MVSGGGLKSIDHAGSRIWTFQDAFEFCVSVPFPPGTRASLRVLSGFDRDYILMDSSIETADLGQTSMSTDDRHGGVVDNVDVTDTRLVRLGHVPLCISVRGRVSGGANPTRVAVAESDGHQVVNILKCCLFL